MKECTAEHLRWQKFRREPDQRLGRVLWVYPYPLHRYNPFNA
ncbi:hypothetical protein BN873_660040 [Candidatus Competibacter denitrificans Run_A_D11]|uniref:Uncharacterized protein n=1 Tax=Candidatus Competibacter denitrificans Run_A_D11 TaxID=1400863 RepID=W6M794_9GAMM|nr:hypothetical protein BN873_660040 [Candidatus Competibacter denitrificans Run_A_D11]